MVLRNKWIYALVFIALLLFAKWKFFPGNSSHQQTKPPQGPVRVNAALVYETEFADEVRVSGTVMPAETVVLQPEVEMAREPEPLPVTGVSHGDSHRDVILGDLTTYQE
jgi:hypothetical protein